MVVGVEGGLLRVLLERGGVKDYNTHEAHPWSPFSLRQAHPGNSPHKRYGGWWVLPCGSLEIMDTHRPEVGPLILVIALS